MPTRRHFLTIAATAAASTALLDAPAAHAMTNDEPSAAETPLRYYYPLPPPKTVLNLQTDLCVVGATPAGIAAAIQARRMNKTVVLLAWDDHLGGMTSGGLGATDIGNKAAIGGISREFYRRLGAHYESVFSNDAAQKSAFVQQTEHGPEAWKFEPHVAEETLHQMCRENGMRVFYHQRLQGVGKTGNRITHVQTEGGHVFRAAYFVDATYEGDLMARANVSHTIGREANAQYGETLNGVHFGHPNHNFKVPVDPFVQPGKPDSGLLVGITPDAPGNQGQGDAHVQAYNFRLCMTHASDRLPFPKPAGYDPARYELLARYIAAQANTTDALRLTVLMPHGKTDTNNWGGFSSDNIGKSDTWPGSDYTTREAIFQDHVTYQQGMMWFLCNDERVPQAVRDETRKWGLPRDEFQTTGGWPHHLYVREGRRMVGDLVMTEKHCRHEETVPDGIGLAAYQMDSHNCRRIARQENGVWTARNEGNVEVPPNAPYPISYRALVPKQSECENLLVPVCVSASHIAYGSIRMEPVFFVLGQSAGTAASMALDAGNLAVQKVNVPALQNRLRADGQILKWNAPTDAATASPKTS